MKETEIQKEKSRRTVRGELALMVAVAINSLGVVLMLHSGAGISAISSVPYAFSEVFTRVSLGTWTYIFQGLLVLSLMILRKKFVPQYLFSFVIGGAGSGIPVYNRLWRENIPFAAGILQENDVEYKAAVALASEVVSEKAFYPVGQDKVQAAKRLIDSCKKCICAVEEFGPLNEANRELAEYARRIGKTGKNI